MLSFLQRKKEWTVYIEVQHKVIVQRRTNICPSIAYEMSSSEIEWAAGVYL